MKLSATKIRFLRGQTKPNRLTDGGGLSLEVRPSGACLWRYRYRLRGKENVFAIGSFPEISLNEARQARDEARKLVEQGVHPAHQRRASRGNARGGSAITFEAVARDWLEEKRQGWSRRTYQQRQRLLENELLPGLGAVPMDQVTSVHFQPTLRRIETRAPQMAVVARQCVGAISRFAIATRRGDKDLTYPLRQAAGTSPRVRRRSLRPHEIPMFFELLDCYPGNFATRAAMRLLWLTLVRPKVVMEATWGEVDLRDEIWTIPPGRLELRGAHLVPLPAQAVALLGELRKVTGDSRHLIPNRSDPTRHAAGSLLNKALASMGYGGQLTPDGIRLTGRALLAEQLGYADAVLPGAPGEDNPCHAGRRLMMQQWADYIDGLCGGRVGRQ